MEEKATAAKKLGIEINDENDSKEKKVYYKIILEMMKYFVSMTEFIYDNIERSIIQMNDIVKEREETIINEIKDGPCIYKNISELQKMGETNFTLSKDHILVKDEYLKKGKLKVGNNQIPLNKIKNINENNKTHRYFILKSPKSEFYACSQNDLGINKGYLLVGNSKGNDISYNILQKNLATH